MSLEVGAIVEGEVTGITNFGAFVQLPEGKVGLIHISEVSNVYVKDVHDFLKEHDKVKVKVLSVDDRGKIGLSIKQLTPPPAPQPRPQRPQNDNCERRNNNGMRPQGDNRERRGGMRPQSARPMAPVSFEDKLSKFLKDSDDRMLDVIPQTGSLLSGRTADTTLSRTTHKIVMRYCKDITPDMWFVYDGIRYNILYIMDPYLDHERLEIFCEVLL